MRALRLWLLLAAASAALACGVRGPPRPPRPEPQQEADAGCPTCGQPSDNQAAGQQ